MVVEEYVNVHNVWTCVRKWGDKNLKKELILCLPGNPGCVRLYDRFLERLHNKLDLPVWIVGHAGHEVPKHDDLRDSIPPLEGNEERYNAKGQIQHKAQFIREHIPRGVKLHLVGHSIGTYCILNLLEEPDIEERVLSCSLLFPTIHGLSSTPLGVFCWWLVRPIMPLVLLLSWLITKIPEKLALIIFSIYFWIIGSTQEVYKDLVEPTRDMITPDIMKRVFHLGFSHIDEVRELNEDVVKRWTGRMKMYYGASDLWAPVRYAYHVRQKCPEAYVDVCSKGYNHAFVTKYPIEVADMVYEWITDWRSDYKK